jgi:hypothetical protein
MATVRIRFLVVPVNIRLEGGWLVKRALNERQRLGIKNHVLLIDHVHICLEVYCKFHRIALAYNPPADAIRTHTAANIEYTHGHSVDCITRVISESLSLTHHCFGPQRLHVVSADSGEQKDS